MSRHDEGRARLIAAARRAAADTVAARVSLRDIAKAANCSPAACYRYFPSREKLIDALAVEVCDEVLVELRRATAGIARAPDRLAAAARAYLLYALANRGAFDLAFERAEGDWAATERSIAGMKLADFFGDLSGRPELGACLWSSVHGLVDMMIKGIIDVGQREQGTSVLPSRGETLLRGLTESLAL